MEHKYGTSNGSPITDEQIQAWADEAERGYDVDEPVAKRRGRPAMGSAPAQVVPVRLDPALDAALTDRAEHDHTTRSDVIRDALRAWLTPA